MNIEAAFNRRMRVTRTSGGVGGCQGAIPGTPPDQRRCADAPPIERCISELSVAAGVPPAVEPWRLARRDSRAKSEWALNLVAGSGRQDAALYGWRDASRYAQSDHHQLGDARPIERIEHFFSR